MTSGRVRVLHVITDAGPHPYFRLIGAHADRDRFDVRLATVGPRGPLHDESERMALPALALRAQGRAAYPAAVVRLARHLRRERIDILQSHLVDGSLVGLPAARLARTPVAILTGHHSHEVPLHRKRVFTWADRLCAGPLSDEIIAPSAQMRDVFLEVHRVPERKVAVVHHGFELARIDPSSVDGAAVRAELGLADRVVIGSIGRHYWIKNQEALVRAFATLASTVPDAVLLLVGAGDPTPLLELARRLGLEEGRLRLLPARGDVPEVLAALDVFVHPALAESFGMVIVEAMAMAVPTVTTPVGIAPEIIRDGDNGILADDGGVESLSRALDRMLQLRADWPAIGRRARIAASAFPASKMVAEYEALYVRLLQRARRTTPGDAGPVR